MVRLKRPGMGIKSQEREEWPRGGRLKGPEKA